MRAFPSEVVGRTAKKERKKEKRWHNCLSTGLDIIQAIFDLERNNSKFWTLE